MIRCDRRPWFVKLQIGGSSVQFKVDSGADKTIISEREYASMKCKPSLMPTSDRFRSITNVVECIGKFDTTVKYGGKKYELDVHIIKGSYSDLLGRSVCKAMGLIYTNLDEAYSNVGLMDTEPVKISIQKGATPYHVRTARRVPIPLMPKVEAE